VTGLNGPPRARFSVELDYDDIDRNGRFDPGRDPVLGLKLVPLEPYSMEGKAMKAAIALLVGVLGQALYILLLLGAALACWVGIMLLIDSQRVLRWNAYLNRWISTGESLRVLDQPARPQSHRVPQASGPRPGGSRRGALRTRCARVQHPDQTSGAHFPRPSRTPQRYSCSPTARGGSWWPGTCLPSSRHDPWSCAPACSKASRDGPIGNIHRRLSSPNLDEAALPTRRVRSRAPAAGWDRGRGRQPVRIA